MNKFEIFERNLIIKKKFYLPNCLHSFNPPIMKFQNCHPAIKRCGALNVGDLLLAVQGKSVARMDVEMITQIIRSPPEIKIVQLEVLPSQIYQR